ncbi:hypothetical protein MMC25_005238 [Agyrium rufum]|nr:hypothetical protein [Agyrium rufum]
MPLQSGLTRLGVCIPVVVTKYRVLTLIYQIATQRQVSFVVSKRLSSSSSEPTLKQTLRKIIPAKRELLKKVKSHGDKVIGEIKVENVIGGMRGLKSMVWEGSALDAETGITFHGHTIAECQRLLPKGKTGTSMLPEAMFWLLLTGQIPSVEQTRSLSRTLAEQSALPNVVRGTIDSLPKTMHPMTQMACAVSALNYKSKFAKAYEQGTVSKQDYWDPTFDDCISLLAKLPQIAARIYQNIYGSHEKRTSKEENDQMVYADPKQDWSYNFAAMLGKGGSENQDFQDLLRLYLALHGDHEGGNVSAHATHLVGSALSDPFLAYSAGLQGLAGPLHGLAAQEVLRWIVQMREVLGEDPTNHTPEQVRDFLLKTLGEGRVIPGYGHAVLRKPDPRFAALMDFASSRPSILADPMFNLVKMTSEVAPQVLTEHGKTKNPFPNVDSASGVLFWHYGFRETLYYTVTFGVSRGLGPLAQLIWDRALGLPIERPKSVTLEGLLAKAEKA